MPAVIQFLLMTPGVEETDFSSLRTLVYGASPISDDVLVKGLERFGCEFVGVYGLTETTGAITQLKGIDHDPVNRPQLLRSCGKPYPWVEMRIVGDDGEDVPIGTVGELWTRSAQNMLGYWNNPDATASDAHARRLAEVRRRGLPRRRRLHLPVRPGEGHDRLGRREHVPGRGRERPDDP